MSFEQTFHCVDCAGEQVFVAVECFDGHGEECAEYACAGCGAAFLLDPPLLRERSPAALPYAA